MRCAGPSRRPGASGASRSTVSFRSPLATRTHSASQKAACSLSEAVVPWTRRQMEAVRVVARRAFKGWTASSCCMLVLRRKWPPARSTRSCATIRSPAALGSAAARATMRSSPKVTEQQPLKTPTPYPLRSSRQPCRSNGTMSLAPPTQPARGGQLALGSAAAEWKGLHRLKATATRCCVRCNLSAFDEASIWREGALWCVVEKGE
mmetsp:Transcript_49578/g.107377  ORF Transcript_49578/g.107377 Transcript_49578/m.107377 type:complete len:206 (-) Transcript_49578:122-739(-)